MGKEELTRRKVKLLYDLVKRSEVLRKALLDGSAWEENTAELVAKVSTKKFKQKRIGAKAAKKAEFDSKGEIRNDAEAT